MATRSSRLYVTDDVASVARPVRELIGFTRVPIPARASRTVTFDVHPSRLAFHGLDMVLATEPGSFTFRIGGSSFDPAMRDVTVTLDGATTAYDRRAIIATTSEVS